jgi:hypothetical protein
MAREHKATFETAEMKFLRCAGGYNMREDKISTKIREVLKICNLNAKIIKSRSQW